jgi:hypothetical protein
MNVKIQTVTNFNFIITDVLKVVKPNCGKTSCLHVTQRGVYFTTLIDKFILNLYRK